MRLLSLAATLAFTAVANASPAAADQIPYPLVCRGGGEMQVIVRSETRRTTRFEILFQRATADATADLAAGQCAWADRPLRDTEPLVLWWELDAPTAVQFKAADMTYPSVTIAAGARDAARAEALIDAVRHDNYFTVVVTNTNSGYFAVSELRPGRPETARPAAAAPAAPVAEAAAAATAAEPAKPDPRKIEPPKRSGRP